MSIPTAVTKSWKTTTLGIVTGLMILLPQLQAVLDTDPATNPSWEMILAGLGAMGIGVAARDNGKSSQDVGVRK